MNGWQVIKCWSKRPKMFQKQKGKDKSNISNISNIIIEKYLVISVIFDGKKEIIER